MADITFSATLDDKAVSKGLDTIASKAKQSTQTVEQSFSKAGASSDQLVSRFASQAASFVSIQRGIQMLRSGLDDYSKKNLDVAASIEKISESKDKLLDSIGSDISPLLDGVATILSKANEIRNRIVNFMVDLPSNIKGGFKYLTTGSKHSFEGTDVGEDFDAAMRKQEKMQKEASERSLVDAEKKKVQEKRLREDNRILEADQLKNQLDLNAKMQEIARKAREQRLSGSTVNDLQQAARDEKAIADRKAIDDEKARKLAFEQSLKAGADQIAQEEEKERQEQKSWQMAQQQLQIEQEKSEIESQSLKNSIDGNKDVVAIMQAKLQLHERLNTIQDNEKIDSQEKEYLATLARTNALESIVHTLENPTMSGAEKRAASVSLTAGAGAIGRAAVFGDRVYSDPPGLKEAREQLNVAKESLKHLSEIALWAKDMATGGDTTIARFGL